MIDWYKYILLTFVIFPFGEKFYEKNYGYLLGVFLGLIFLIVDYIMYKKNKKNLPLIIVDFFIIILFLYGYFE